MSCPTIKYGAPSTGASEYSTNSGRELFRCGTECVKMFITNVTLEKNTVKFVCGDIADAKPSGLEACLQTLNGTWRDRTIANWIAKDDATSAVENGYVINRVGKCSAGGYGAGGTGTNKDGLTYTHTEGQISFRALLNIQDFTPAMADTLKTFTLAKFASIAKFADEDTILQNLTWIFSDINNTVSQTDWQSGGGTFQGFGTRTFDGERTYSVNFNYNNGQGEEKAGHIWYDDSQNVSHMMTVVQMLLSTAA